MRQLLVCVLLAILVRAGDAAQNAQGPADVFRGKVDLVTIDVSATDSRGRPVEDLKPGDFTIKVDGKPRPVASVELIKIDRAKPATPTRPVDALVVSNVSPQNARRIVVAVDQTLITPGMLTPLLRTAGQFVDRLMPADYAAFIGFPEPGPRVDFTTDKALVHKAMQAINIGQPAKTQTSMFNISLYEAAMITGAESIRNKLADIPKGSSPPGPVMTEVMKRECPDSGLDDEACRRAIYNDSLGIAAQARMEGTISLRALEALLKDLASLDGPKTMVVFSAGLVNEDPTRLDDLAKLAAAARTTINFIAVDRDRGELISERNITSFSPLADRSFELEGLEGDRRSHQRDPLSRHRGWRRHFRTARDAALRVVSRCRRASTWRPGDAAHRSGRQAPRCDSPLEQKRRGHDTGCAETPNRGVAERRHCRRRSPFRACPFASRRSCSAMSALPGIDCAWRRTWDGPASLPASSRSAMC